MANEEKTSWLRERIYRDSATTRPRDCGCTALRRHQHPLRQCVAGNCPRQIGDLRSHAEIGTEANSKYSAMPFASLKQLTDQYLEPLVEQDRWQVIKGLGC